MQPDQRFTDENISRAEAILLGHEIARTYFRGELYDRSNRSLLGLSLERHGGGALVLDAATTGRLFMIPDGSTVWATNVGENQDGPSGLDVRSTSPFLAEGEQNSVVAFLDEAGSAIWVEALYVRRLMFAHSAPQRLATVAFGLMAATAYRLGFAHISLFAAGHGPLRPADPDAFIGYAVWPKFGFDAPVSPVELNRQAARELLQSVSVQDVIARNPQWWMDHGTGRTMRFDLTPGSRSWSILLHYLYEALVERQP